MEREQRAYYLIKNRAFLLDSRNLVERLYLSENESPMIHFSCKIFKNQWRDQGT